MIADIRTVIWKEWLSLRRFPGGRWRLGLVTIMPIAFFAFYGPATAGPGWVEQPDALFVAVVVPLVVGMMVTPDSFAGERERRTLATLLSSRLPDRAILTGKVVFGVAVSWVMALLTTAAAVGVVNLFNRGEGFLMLTPLLLLSSVVISLLVAVLTVAVGIMVSLRAGTVQQAQQLVAAVLLIPPMIAGPIVAIAIRNDPQALTRFFEAGNAWAMFFAAVAALITADVVLGWFATRLFRRDRLIANLPNPS
jgi:ABC-2 type transport system permease protein